MKKIVFVLNLIFVSSFGYCQISIDSTDMPVPGDVLTESNVNVLSVQGLEGYAAITDTGSNIIWNFSDFTSSSQTVNQYQSLTQINPILLLELPTSEYGIKVADTILSIPDSNTTITLYDLYAFYQQESNPNTFDMAAYAAFVDGLPIPFKYTDPDEVYYFPLLYGDVNYSTYRVELGLGNTLGLVETGSRTTKMDGWGTVVTPYFTTPQNCLRVRSEMDETDSIIIDSFAFAIPKSTVDYKWMVKGVHAPVVQISTLILLGVEVVTNIQYLDSAQQVTKVNSINGPRSMTIEAYPNPATDGYVNLTIPQGWNYFAVEVFDMTGKGVASFTNSHKIDIHTLPSGQYLIRVISGSNTGYAKIVR